jgi:hypothetical protein
MQALYRNKYQVKTNDGINNTLMTIFALNKKAAESIALSLLSDYGRVTLFAKVESESKNV